MQQPGQPVLETRASTPRLLLLWGVFALAFGPVFVDAARHLQEHPWTRYVVLFPVLFVLTLLRGEQAAPPRRDGWGIVAAGFPLLAYGAVMGTIRLGRVSAGLAALGLCRSLGIGSTRSQALLLFSVPLPGSLALGAASWLPGKFLAWAEAALHALGFEATSHHLTLALEQGALEINRYDGGLTLVPLCVGLAWYLAGIRKLEPLPTSVAIGLAAALAPALQFGFILAGAVCAALGLSAAGQWLVAHEWVVIAIPVVAFAELAQRGTASR